MSENKYEISVLSDFNDGDDVLEVTPVDQEELDKMKPLFEKLMSYKGHNWEDRANHLTEEEIEEIQEYLGYPPVDGAEFHTVNKVTAVEIGKLIWNMR